MCEEGTTNREILIYWLFVVVPTRVSVVFATAWICCSESCECFKISCHIFNWMFFCFFFPWLCLAGWSCHERMMSVTNNKTDMFTEDWRAGFIFGINSDFCGIKKCENMMQGSDCFFRKVLTLQRMLFRRKTTKQNKKNTTNEAESAPGVSCVGLHPVLPLTGCRALTPSFLSGQCGPHIRHMLTYILNLVTVWPWTPTVCTVRSNQHALELYFYPLSFILPCHL